MSAYKWQNRITTKIPNVLFVICPFQLVVLLHSPDLRVAGAGFTCEVQTQETTGRAEQHSGQWTELSLLSWQQLQPEAESHMRTRRAARPAHSVVRNSDISTERHRAAISSLRSNDTDSDILQGINSSNNTEKRPHSRPVGDGHVLVLNRKSS